jgi:hypothetical protein
MLSLLVADSFPLVKKAIRSHQAAIGFSTPSLLRARG